MHLPRVATADSQHTLTCSVQQRCISQTGDRHYPAGSPGRHASHWQWTLPRLPWQLCPALQRCVLGMLPLDGSRGLPLQSPPVRHSQPLCRYSLPLGCVCVCVCGCAMNIQYDMLISFCNGSIDILYAGF